MWIVLGTVPAYYLENVIPKETPVKRLLLLSAFLVALPAFGQLAPYHRFDLYSSPEAASTAHDALMPSQREIALIIPFRHDFSAFTREQNAEAATYAVAYQAAPWQEGGVEAAITSKTIVWHGPESCGWGMKTWEVASFATAPDAKKFYDALIPIQKGTAYLLPTVGPQIQRYRYLVVYQALVSNCY